MTSNKKKPVKGNGKGCPGGGYNEQIFTREVMKYAKDNRWKAAHFKAAIMPSGRWATPVQGDAKGFFDLVLVRDTKFMVVELKMYDGEFSQEQIDWAMAVQAAGIHYDVWTPEDWDKIRFILGDVPMPVKTQE